MDGLPLPHLALAWPEPTDLTGVFGVMLCGEEDSAPALSTALMEV